jgi:hypothetical protein
MFLCRTLWYIPVALAMFLTRFSSLFVEDISCIHHSPLFDLLDDICREIRVMGFINLRSYPLLKGTVLSQTNSVALSPQANYAD